MYCKLGGGFKSFFFHCSVEFFTDKLQLLVDWQIRQSLENMDKFSIKFGIEVALLFVPKQNLFST